MTVRLGCLLLLVLASALLAGCRHDAEINAALAEVDSFTDEMVKRIDASPNLSAGVDDAQQYLDSRKHEIKVKATYLARVRGIEASAETEKKLVDTIRQKQMTVASLPTQTRFATLYASDPTLKPKLDKLVKDYLELFQT